MEQYFNLFENLNEIVYIADADTMELVYLNKFAIELYGSATMEELRGRKCHEVFRSCDHRCEMCSVDSLAPGQFCESSYYSPALARTLTKKDTIIEHDGKRYLLGIAIDITAQVEQEEVIRSMLVTESMINNALSAALREEDPNCAIEVFLSQLGERTRSERVYIFEESPDGDYVVNTYEWCAENVTPQKEFLSKVPKDVVKYWYEYFNQGKNLIITDVEEIKETDVLVYEYLVPQDIHSLVVSPLVFDGRIIGFYGTDNPPAELMRNISEMAWTIGYFISTLLRKRELIGNLEELSYFEQLTGLHNRHAMEAFCARKDSARNLGIIYCDVMGLKRINDSQGHQAGDELLLRAADCLKKHFERTELYRIGGDEFLVLCEGIDRGDFGARIETLRTDMTENNALMALGHVWAESTDDIEKLIIEADQLMYAEKQAYYAAAAKAGLLDRRSGDKRRRRKGFFRRRKQQQQ